MPVALLKILQQYNMLESKDHRLCHYSVLDLMGIPCHYILE
jgi:hypothetical protein